MPTGRCPLSAIDKVIAPATDLAVVRSSFILLVDPQDMPYRMHIASSIAPGNHSSVTAVS